MLASVEVAGRTGIRRGLTHQWCEKLEVTSTSNVKLDSCGADRQIFMDEISLFEISIIYLHSITSIAPGHDWTTTYPLDFPVIE